MKKYTIYLCGGMANFGKENFSESNSWRKYCKIALEGCECKYDVEAINPNDFYNFYDKPAYASEREVMNFDLYKLRNSDLVLVNFNDIYSLGSMAEIAIAFENRIPVIGILGKDQELHPWQKCMCERIFFDLNGAVDYIQDFYLR